MAFVVQVHNAVLSNNFERARDVLRELFKKYPKTEIGMYDFFQVFAYAATNLSEFKIKNRTISKNSSRFGARENFVGMITIGHNSAIVNVGNKEYKGWKMYINFYFDASIKKLRVSIAIGPSHGVLSLNPEAYVFGYRDIRNSSTKTFEFKNVDQTILDVWPPDLMYEEAYLILHRFNECCSLDPEEQLIDLTILDSIFDKIKKNR